MIAANENNIRYPLLEYRSNKDNIPYIKGTNYRVDQIYILPHKAWKLEPKQIAREKNLPLETIVEAIRWCDENAEILNEVLEKEAKVDGVK